MTKDEALKLALEALNRGESELRWEAIAAIEEVLAQPGNGEKCHDCGGMGYQDGIGDRCPTCNGFGQQPEQEPVAMRMPKVGDRVVCIEDESLATVQSLTAGGSPDIKFDDGSHGTYLLREFAELFRYASTQQRTWVGLSEQQQSDIEDASEMMIGIVAFSLISDTLKANNT